MWVGLIIRAKQMPVIWTYAKTSLIVTVLCMVSRDLIALLGVGDEGSLYVLATYSLVHGNIAHWFFGVLILLAVGLVLEPRIGALKTACILLADIVTTGIGYAVFGGQRQDGVTLVCDDLAYAHRQ